MAGLFYLVITTSLAEMASALPSAGGVYHWASVTPGKKAGRVIGFFAGYWNSFAYSFGAASLAAVAGEAIVGMYSLHHLEFEPQRWHVFICYIIVVWLCCAILLFTNRLLPKITNVLAFLVIGGWFVSVLCVAILPSQGGRSHASTHFVWKDWQNLTGYSSNVLVFVLGMLNGSFSIGTPDCSTHLAEEIPRPERNIPKAMFTQMTSSFLTTLIFLIVLFYSVSDFDVVVDSTAEFLLTEIYLQATGSLAGATGLTIVALLPVLGSVMGSMLTASRVFWTIARDDGTPFPRTFGHVSKRYKNPFAAIIFIACFCTVMGCIYLGSETAFAALTGSFVVLTTLSYLAALLPFLLRGRKSLTPGPFFIHGVAGYIVNATSCLFMMVWIVFYCFPYELPVEAANMNYSSLIAGGLTVIIGIWWLMVQKRYEGPGALVSL